MNSLVDEVRWVPLAHTRCFPFLLSLLWTTWLLAGDVSNVILFTVKWFTGELVKSRDTLLWMCYTMSLTLPLNCIAPVIEMPGEQDNSYVKYQMSIQTGLKWPKDIGVCRWNCYRGSQRKSLTCLFQMEQNGPEVKITKHQTCLCNTIATWKGLKMQGTLFSWDISCVAFVRVRQIEGKVVEISRLQEIFAEKVLQQVSRLPSISFTWTLQCFEKKFLRTHCPCHFPWQETEIDSIHQLVVGATENVKEGNEDIREVTVTKWKQPARLFCMCCSYFIM